MKTCEFCGSTVPNDTDVCPNCAAHFADVAGPPVPFAHDPRTYDASSPPDSLSSMVNRGFAQVGKSVAIVFGLYILLMFLLWGLGTFLGIVGQSSLLILAVLLFVAAVLVARKAF